jgi:hypothetical protein
MKIKTIELLITRFHIKKYVDPRSTNLNIMKKDVEPLAIVLNIVKGHMLK